MNTLEIQLLLHDNNMSFETMKKLILIVCCLFALAEVSANESDSRMEKSVQVEIVKHKFSVFWDCMASEPSARERMVSFKQLVDSLDESSSAGEIKSLDREVSGMIREWVRFEEDASTKAKLKSALQYGGQPSAEMIASNVLARGRIETEEEFSLILEQVDALVHAPAAKANADRVRMLNDLLRQFEQSREE